MKFSEALDAYLTTRAEAQRLLGQLPVVAEVVEHAQRQLARRAADLDAMFLAQDQVREEARNPEAVVASYNGVKDEQPVPEMVSRSPTPVLTSENIDRQVAGAVENYIERRDMSPEEYAVHTSLSPSTIKRVLDVDDGMTITMETARKLMPSIQMCACCGQTVKHPVVAEVTPENTSVSEKPSKS